MQPAEQKIGVYEYETNLGFFFKMSIQEYYQSNYIVNGRELASLPKRHGYFCMSESVSLVQKKVPSQSKLVGFELINKDLASDRLPAVMTRWELDADDEWVLNGISGISSLYQKVYEQSEPSLVDVPFEVFDMGKYVVTNPTDIGSRKIEFAQQSSWREDNIVEKELATVVCYDDIVALLTPEFAMHQAPCRLTSKQMYQITRAYLKKNLDFAENIITSDYDFCFTVKKRVHTKPFITNKAFLSGKKWKSKKVTVTEKQVEVFEMTWAGYKGNAGYEGYTCIPEMHGDNLEDLGNKLTEWLEDITEQLNRRIVECEHCGGHGHIIEKVDTE